MRKTRLPPRSSRHAPLFCPVMKSAWLSATTPRPIGRRSWRERAAPKWPLSRGADTARRAWRRSQCLATGPTLLFCDADAGSPAEELRRVLEPVREGRADLAIGARTHAEPGSMTPPQRFGNWLAVRLIALFWRRKFYDLGPTRAIARTSYRLLGMTDRTWGWTVEMQILAVVRGLNVVEVDVGWRKRRHGRSKISGTLSGVLRAGWRIMWTIGKLAVTRGMGVSPMQSKGVAPIAELSGSREARFQPPGKV